LPELSSPIYSLVVARSVQWWGYGLDNWVSVPGRANEGIFFHFINAFRLVMRPTQPPVQRVPGDLTLGIMQLGC